MLVASNNLFEHQLLQLTVDNSKLTHGARSSSVCLKSEDRITVSKVS